VTGRQRDRKRERGWCERTYGKRREGGREGERERGEQGSDGRTELESDGRTERWTEGERRRGDWMSSEAVAGIVQTT